MSWAAGWLSSAKVKETQTGMEHEEQCRDTRVQEGWSSWAMVQPTSGFPNPLNSPLRLPVLHLCHYLLLSAIICYSCDCLLIPSSSSRFLLPPILLSLHVCLCLSLLTSFVPAVSFFPVLETRAGIWFLPENPIQNSFGHSTFRDVLQGHLEATVSLSFLSVRSTLLVRKHCSAALYLS